MRGRVIAVAKRRVPGKKGGIGKNQAREGKGPCDARVENSRIKQETEWAGGGGGKRDDYRRGKKGAFRIG